MSSASLPKKMTYVRLGNSGLKVSRIILGIGSYGNKAYDAGIQTFDTANTYSHGESERISGKAIKELNLPRDEIVILTKYTRKAYNIVAQAPGLHIVPSPTTDAAGYVNQYGLGRKMFGVGMIPWSPLSQGVLSRPCSQTSLRSETSSFSSMWKQTKEDNKKIVLRLEQIAKNRGISMAQVAIVWSLSKDMVTAPIIGTTSLENLEDTIGAIDVKLTDEEIRLLEESYAYVAQAIQGYD
ncbi:unnamed protein product [Rhizoctonia solani]|uniref:NADP-dependent oxidoreductase domain-containing protein n=1 Tax=Rhizoctonia solani TaxID=456999 RepID=A0A8H3A978_9AGAM|nr:unnamed protein product [Rhizoctonia solani]